MKALQTSGPAKLAAALLLLLAAFAAGLCGSWALLCYPLAQADSWQETSEFDSLLRNREDELASFFADAAQLSTVGVDDQALSYVQQQELQAVIDQTDARMNASATSFRFQVLSADGSQVLYTNLAEGQTLEQAVDSVHYASFQVGQYYVNARYGPFSTSFYIEEDIAYDGTAELASESLVIRCGVPDNPGENPPEDEFSTLFQSYWTARANFSGYLIGMAAALALSCLSLLYLLWTAGHRAGREDIALSWQERIPTELWILLAAGGGFAALCGFLNILDLLYSLSVNSYGQLTDALFSLLPFAAALCAAGGMVLGSLFLRTLLVRLKAGAFLRTTLVCMIWRWLWGLVYPALRGLPLIWKWVVLFPVYLLLNLYLCQWFYWYGSGYLLLLYLLLNGAVLLAICWWALCFRRLQDGGRNIAAGNYNRRVDTARMPHDLKDCGESLNNISAGLSAAVDEKMKSERFKAELITNVSHDLKTPLTSIINYVNLLKSTRQDDPKAQEYIEVLDRKSQRLKKLTEDLVEASKASTGVLSVSREKIGMGQLIDQALGEWSEKLEERKLTLVPTLPEGETWVYADGRHLWRVIDNLLSNCAKYAMEGTRVYLDLERGKGQVTLSIKNISREPLNIPPERLMERFVRGDESRTTEGSGLGLSIARSLTELQGGEFQLTVDGDLFKASVTLPQAS